MSARDVLDRWQALAGLGTEGKWEVSDSFVWSPEVDSDVARVYWVEDAKFIAAARTIVPAAVKALRDVLDELDEWERAGHLSIEMVHIRRAIEAAIGGEGR